MEQPRTTQTLTGWERVAVAVVFAAAIVVSVVIVGRVGGPPGDVVGPAEARPSIPGDVPRPVSLVDAYELAMEWAMEWDEEAWPILVSAQFEFPMDGDVATPEATEGFVIFTFAAPEQDGEWARLNLAVGRQSGTIYHEDEVVSSVVPPPSIHDLLTGLPVSAESAFRVADEVVGTGYREGCAPSRRQVQVVLDATDPEPPAWVVVYFDLRERSVNDIVVRVDAQTGRTTTEIRDDPSCDME